MIIRNIKYNLDNISLRKFLLFFITNSIYYDKSTRNFFIRLEYKDINYSIDCTGFLYTKEELLINKKIEFINYDLNKLRLLNYDCLYKEITYLLHKIYDYR